MTSMLVLLSFEEALFRFALAEGAEYAAIAVVEVAALLAGLLPEGLPLPAAGCLLPLLGYYLQAPGAWASNWGVTNSLHAKCGGRVTQSPLNSYSNR